MSSLIVDTVKDEVGYIVDRINTIVSRRKILEGAYGIDYFLQILTDAISKGERLLRQIDLVTFQEKYQTTIRTK